MLNIGEKKTFVVGTQKNRLIETVPPSTQNTCLMLVRKSYQFYAYKIIRTIDGTLEVKQKT